MAIRYVLVRFGSNIGSFVTDMQKATTANNALAKANMDLASAHKAQEAASLTSQRALNQYHGSTGPLQRSINDLAKAEQQGAAKSIAAAQQKVATQQASAAKYGQALNTAKQEEADAAAATQAAADRQVKAMEQAAERTASYQKKMSLGMGLGGAAMLFGFYEAAKAAVQFDNAMSQAAAVSTYTATHMKEMSASVLDLSRIFPIAANDFAGALTVVEQAGYKGQAAIAILNQAAIGATVGMTDIKTAAEDLTRTINGMGVGLSGAVEVNDVLIAAVQNGISTYGEFGKALSEVSPLARSLGVSASDTAGAIAMMTSTSLDASAAGMALQRMLFQMLKPGTDASKMVVDLARKSGDFASQTAGDVVRLHGLSAVVTMIGQATQGAGENIAQFFPNVRQARAAFALFADGGAAAVERMHEFSDANQLAINALQALQQRQASAAVQQKIAMNDLHATGIEIGQNLLPMVNNLAHAVQALTSAFSSLPPGAQRILTVVGVMAGTFMLVKGAMGLLLPFIQSSINGFRAMATSADAAVAAEDGVVVATEAVTASTGPIGLLIAAVSALTAAYLMLHHTTAGQAQQQQQWDEAVKSQAAGAAGAAGQMGLLEIANMKAIDSLKNMKISLVDVTGQMGQGNDAIEAHKELVQQFSDAYGVGVDKLQQMGMSLNDAKRAHTLLDQAIGGDYSANDRFLALMKQYHIVFPAGTSALAAVITAQHDYGDALNRNKGQLQATAEEQQQNNAALAASGDFAKDASDSLKQLSDDEKNLSTSIKNFVSVSTAFDAAAKNVKGDTDMLTDASKTFTDMMQQATKDQQAAADNMAQTNNEALKDSTQAAQQNARNVRFSNQQVAAAYRASTSSSSSSLYGVNTALKANSYAAQTHARTVAQANQDATKTAKEFKTEMGNVTISASQYIAGLEKSAKSTKDWQAALDAVKAHGGSDDLIASLRKLGMDALPTVLQMAKQTPPAIAKANAAIAEMSPTAEKAQASFSDFATAFNKQMADEQSWEDNLSKLMGLGGGQYSYLAQSFAKEGQASGRALSEAIALAQKDPQNPMLAAAEASAERAAAITKDGYSAGLQNQFDAMSAAVTTAGVQLGNTLGTTGGTTTIAAITKAMGQGFTEDTVRTILQPLTKLLSDLHVTVTDINIAPGATPGAPGAPGTPAPGKPAPTPPDSPGANRVPLKPGPEPPPPNIGTPIAPPVTGQGPVPYGPGQGPVIGPPIGNPIGNPIGDPIHNRQANGSLMFFAAGGERHIAQMARAGDWRVWAEPETGGEAYIPLGASKRPRSTQLLGAVAHRFGYGLVANADGMMYPAGSSLVSSGSQGGQPSVVVVRVREQQSNETTYQFNGPIQGYSLEKVQADADRKRRQSALVGRRR